MESNENQLEYERLVKGYYELHSRLVLVRSFIAERGVPESSLYLRAFDEIIKGMVYKPAEDYRFTNVVAAAHIADILDVEFKHLFSAHDRVIVARIMNKPFDF